jgi:Flp pilus assembly protein TadD
VKKLVEWISYANYQLWLFGGLGLALWLWSPANGPVAPPRAVYQWAVEQDEGFALGHRVLAGLDESEHRDLAALAHYRAATSSEPFDHTTCLAHGKLAERLGLNDEALEAYRCAARYDRSNGPAHGRLAAMLQRKGELVAAGDEFRLALALDPSDDQARLGLGVNLAASGRLAEAAPYLELAAQHLPSDADASFNVGLLYRKLGRSPEALRALERTVQLDPHRTPAWGNLIELELQLGASDRARQHLELWLRVEPGNPAAQQLLDQVGAQ